jgi:hypothetical protein
MQGTEFLHLALDGLAADAGCDIPAWCRRQRRGSGPGGRGLCCIGHSRPRSDQSCSGARFDETVGPRGAGGHRCGFGATRQQHDKMEEDNRTEMAHGHSPAHKLRTRPPSMHGATSRTGRTTTRGLSRRDGLADCRSSGKRGLSARSSQPAGRHYRGGSAICHDRTWLPRSSRRSTMAVEGIAERRVQSRQTPDWLLDHLPSACVMMRGARVPEPSSGMSFLQITRPGFRMPAGSSVRFIIVISASSGSVRLRGK